MIKQNRQDAERLLERIVREKGEDKTAHCNYSTLEDNDKGFEFVGGKWVTADNTPIPESYEVAPICIVGCAVFEIGGVESLINMPMDTVASNVGHVKHLFDDAAVRYLNAAQWIQDHKGTWGEALAVANSVPDEVLVKNGGALELYDLLKPKLDELRASKKG